MESTSKTSGLIGQFLPLVTYGRRALELVWATSRLLTLTLATLTVIAGLLPAAIAWVGKELVDSVVLAIEIGEMGPAIWFWLSLEALLVAVMAAAQTALGIANNLLRAQLGQRVNVMILEKAQSLELAQLEDAEFYDRLTRARREASSRPLALVQKTFGVIQNGIAILSFSGLLLAFSPWAVLLLVVGGLPAFFVEARFAGQAFQLFRWRSPDTREMMYLESVLAREDYTKEVKLYNLAPTLLARYRAIFAKLFREDRALTIRRGWWAFRPRPAWHRRLVRGLCLGRGGYGAGTAVAWADDDVHDGVPSGPVGGQRQLELDQRHVRRPPLPIEPV